MRPYETVYAGNKYRLMDIQAALGIHQLARVEANLKTRERYWQLYDQPFADLPEVLTPSTEVSPGSRHARHVSAILLGLDRMTISRDQFIQGVRAQNIRTGIHFTALHLHKCYLKSFGYQVGDRPNAEWIGSRTVSLPLSPRLTEEDVADVIQAVRQVVARYRHT